MCIDNIISTFFSFWFLSDTGTEIFFCLLSQYKMKRHLHLHFSSFLDMFLVYYILSKIHLNWEYWLILWTWNNWQKHLQKHSSKILQPSNGCLSTGYKQPSPPDSASGEAIGQGIPKVVYLTVVMCLLDVSGHFKPSELSD